MRITGGRGVVYASIEGTSVKTSVRAATTAAGTLASSFENGDTVDGVVLATGNRILIKNQASGAENGIYVVAASGAPTRATDADASPEVLSGTFVWVEEGTANADSGWILNTADPITLGTTALTFARFSGAKPIVAGAGISKTGQIVAVVVDADTIEVNGSNQVALKAGGIVNAHVKSSAAIAWSKIDKTGAVASDVGAQPADADLTAIAGLTSAADKAPYFTGSGTAALMDVTAAGRALLDDASAAAQIVTLGLASIYQPLDAELTALAGLTSAADKAPYFTGSGAAALMDVTAAGRALLDDASAAAQIVTLGLAALYQPIDAELTAIAALTSAADKLPYFTGSGTAAVTAFTAAGRTLVGNPDAAAMRDTLELGSAAVVSAGAFDAAGVAATLIAAHEADTTAVHGITNTSLLVTTTGTQTLTNKTLTFPRIDGSFGAIATITYDVTPMLDWASGNQQKITLTGDAAFAVTGATVGQTLDILVIQDGTGSHAVTWFGGIVWFTSDFSAPTIAAGANKQTWIKFKCVSSGVYHGFLMGKSGN